MKKYSWIAKLGKSLVPSEFYIHILKESIGKAILYMLLFIALLSVTAGAYQGYKLKIGIDASLADYRNDIIPPVSIINGQLKIDQDGTVLIDYFDPLIVLNDGDFYDVNQFINEKDIILFGNDSVSITRRGIGPIIYNYKDFLFYDINESEVTSFLEVASTIIIPLSMISQFFASVLGFFFNSIFVLLMVNIIRTFVGLALRIKQLYHMTIYAMTFSVFWTHFIIILPNPVPDWLNTFVYYVIPSIILLNVFMIIRKRAKEELEKKK